MFRFFSKIKKKLISGSQFRNYTLYAIGEIFLVVIGILIALQINNWNEYRKDRNKEQEILVQLKDEYTRNLAQLDEKIEIRKRVINGSRKLLYYADDQRDVSNDSILKYLALTGFNPTFDPISNDIISSGKLSLILDDSLRLLLSSWTSDLVQVTEEEVAWRKFVNEYRKPFLIRQGILRDRLHHVWKSGNINMAFIDKNIEAKALIGESKKKIDYKRLFDLPEFESMMALGISSNVLANIQSQSLRKRILQILDLIEKNLD